VSYGLGLMFYETQVCFAPLLIRMGLRNKQRKARWGHLVLTVAYLLANLALRWAARGEVTYPGTRVSPSFLAIRALFNQMTGALPTIYAIFGRSDLFTGADLVSDRFFSWPGILIASVGFWLYLVRSARMDPSPSPRGVSVDLILLGGSLWFLPSLLISASAKYQADIHRPGLAYLPVYLSYFGVALLMALILEQGKRRKAQAMVFAFLAIFAFSSNRIAAQRLNAARGGPRSALAWIVE
jgi:hypothetical protein